MNGSLLDTSVLIAPAATSLAQLPPAAAISIISIGELHAGVLLARDGRIREARRLRLGAVRSTFVPLVVDETVAESYGGILAAARSQGRTEKATDLLIVATAVATSRTLYTRDLRQAQLAQAVGALVETI